MYFDLIHSPQLIPDSPQLPYPPNLVFSLKKKKNHTLRYEACTRAWSTYQVTPPEKPSVS